VERCDEDAEVQWTVHDDSTPDFKLDRNSSSNSLTRSGPFLLQPVSGAVDQHLAVTAGHHLGRAVGAHETQYRVGGSADEHGRHVDGGGRWVGHDLPVAVQIAIPVQPAGEPGAGELGDVMVDLVRADPGGQAVVLR